MQELKKSTASYSLEAVKMAIAETTLNEKQIERILSSKGLTGETLKTTTAELTAITTTNKLSASQEVATGTTSKFGFAMKGLLSSFLKFVKTPLGVATIIASTIGIVYTAVKKHNQKLEEARQKIIETGEAANSKITEIQQKLDKLNTSVKSASNSYTKLMDGIEKSSNANISLSSEDYDEFISSSNELAEMFPELVIGLDNEGNKILALGNNAEEATNKLNDLIEAQKIILANETKNNLKDSFKGVYVENENQRNEIAKYNDLKSQINPDLLISDLLGTSGSSISLPESAFPDIDAQLLMNNVAKVINDALGTEIKPEYLDLTGEWFIPLSDLTEEQLNKALESVKINKDYLYKTVTDYIDISISKVEDDINSDYQGKLVEIFTALSGEDVYNQLGDDSKTIVNSIISNLNYSSVQDVIDKDYGGSIVEYIKKQIIDEFNNAQNDPNISKALSEVFTNTKLTPDDKLNYLKQIQSYFGEDNIITISLQPQLEDTELLQKQYDDAINRFAESEQQTIDDLKIKYQEAIDKRKELYSGSNYVGNVDINNRLFLEHSREIEK